MYKIHKIGTAKIHTNKVGRKASISATINLIAPTKKGDDWSLYIGNLTVDANKHISFEITHINSSAWGNSAWRSPPFGYDRSDIKRFIVKECQTLIGEWQLMLAQITEE